MNTTTNSTKPVISLAWDWGFDDAMAGKNEYHGYDYFAEPKLSEYMDGHRTAQLHKKNLKRIAGGSDQYAPFSDPALRNVQPAEYRDDHIGF